MKQRPTSSQKRSVLKKARRLAYAEAEKKLAKVPSTREVIVTAARHGTGNLVFTTRTGLFSGARGPAYTVEDVQLVGCLDSPGEFGMMVARLGLLVASAIFRTNAYAPDVVKETSAAAVKWLGVDVEALRKAAAEEMTKEAEAAKKAAEQAALTPPPEIPTVQLDVVPQ